MTRPVSTCALLFTLLAVSVAQADWFYNFTDGVMPDDLILEDNYYPGEQPSSTFDPRVQDEHLLLFDPVPRHSGGAVRASAKNSEVFTDVRVSAVINPTGEIPCVFQGVSARRKPGSAYYAAVVNAPGYGNSGNFAIGKNADSFMLEATDFGYSRLTDFSIPYRIDLEVITEHDAEVDKD